MWENAQLLDAFCLDPLQYKYINPRHPNTALTSATYLSHPGINGGSVSSPAQMVSMRPRGAYYVHRTYERIHPFWFGRRGWRCQDRPLSGTTTMASVTASPSGGNGCSLRKTSRRRRRAFDPNGNPVAISRALRLACWSECCVRCHDLVWAPDYIFLISSLWYL